MSPHFRQRFPRLFSMATHKMHKFPLSLAAIHFKYWLQLKSICVRASCKSSIDWRRAAPRPRSRTHKPKQIDRDLSAWNIWSSSMENILSQHACEENTAGTFFFYAVRRSQRRFTPVCPQRGTESMFLFVEGFRLLWRDCLAIIAPNSLPCAQ